MTVSKSLSLPSPTALREQPLDSEAVPPLSVHTPTAPTDS